MRGWIKYLVALSVVLGTSGSVFGAFLDFNVADGDWDVVGNWNVNKTNSATQLPGSGDTVRFDYDTTATIKPGTTGTAAKVSIGGFSGTGTLIVNAGGTLSLGSIDSTIATSRKTGTLDVSGTLSGTGDLLMGGNKTGPTGTVLVKSGAVVSMGAISVGNGLLAGTYSVTQSGGAVSLSGELVIADVDDSITTGTYTIRGGSLSAVRLNTGGNGTSTAKFSVFGSAATNISFSTVSWLGGQTELEFILDTNGVSELDMTAGGYTVASTVSLTVDASAYSGTIGGGILLIGTTNAPSAFNAVNVLLTSGYGLDYRTDGLYLITNSPPLAPGFRDFVETGAGTDDRWTTVANWTQGVLPTLADSARIQKDCVIANGVSAEAVKVSIGGFASAGTVIVDAGGTLSLGGLDNTIATSRKDGTLDVSGTLSGTGDLWLGGSDSSAGTVLFKPGAVVSMGAIILGNGSSAGTYSVTQSGGAVEFAGDLFIADVDDSLSTGSYTIHNGSLSATGLNTGGNGTSMAKFSVVGSAATNISFSSVSSLDGQTELEFILATNGVSALMMTNGGYTVASTVSLTVDASAYSGSTGDGMLLIGTTDAPPAFNAANVSVPLGYDLDYRPDGLYLTGASSPAAVSPLFHDNMVLQRDMDTPVWGYDAPGSNVTVKLDGVVVGTAVADGNGDWITGIGSHAHDGGQAHVLTVEFGVGSIQFNEVVFGDVYLASGQSNMNMPMAWIPSSLGTGSYAEELTVADSFPLIRQVSVSSETSTNVLADPPLQINWTKCSQASLRDFSAVGYFFAKNLYQETGVPIGLLFSAWGGKSIEQFTSPSGMEAVPELAGMLEYQEEGGVQLLYKIYNAMIAPLMPYGIKGAIWYQGENNGNDGDIYKYKMKALARGWRKEWGQGDFPFYYVQLASFNTSGDWPGLRNAQTAALSETNFGMAVTIDVGEYSDIHPRNKYDVGGRLARWALAKDYGKNIVYSSPLYRSTVVEDPQIRVLFDYADSGLFVGQKTGTDDWVETSEPLQNFEIAGADKIFVAADAVIDRDSVLVSAASVSSPMHVRYCWASFPAGSNLLYNAAGLPASPFNSAESYNLSVVSGSGTATGLASGSVQSISANAPASGTVFDRWIGAASEITNPNASSTTVTMPEHSLYLLASYRDTSESVYTLTVNNGYGSGTSQAGSILNIEAVGVAGQDFSHWAGDTQTVVNVNGSSTTLRMPTNNIQVTAVYHIIDSVGDGVSDEWRATYFGGDGSSTNSVSSANADPDGDGMTNLQEFHAGTSPVNAQSSLSLAGNFFGTDALIQFQTVEGLRYQLWKTSSLDPISWEAVYYNITGDGKQKSLQLDIGGEPTSFYRLWLSDN